MKLSHLAKLVQGSLLLSLLSNLVVVPAFLASDRPEFVLTLLALGTSATLLSSGVAGITWFIWQYQLVKQTADRGVSIGVSPEMSLVWWIVCFANFYMPYKIFRDLEQALTGNFGKSSAIVKSWWFFWIFSSICGRTIDLKLNLISVVASVLTVTAAMLAMYVVGHFTDLAEAHEMGAPPQTF